MTLRSKDKFFDLRNLSKQEIRALLVAALAKRERDWLMILVAYHHGLRVSELLSIQTNDVRDGFLDVQRLKGSMRTVQPLMEDADPLLDERLKLVEYASKSTSGTPIFNLTRQRFYQIIQEHGKRAGIAAHKLFPHALRHSIASHVIHSAGIENTRQWLGHRSISSTGEYLKVSDEDASRAVISAVRGVGRSEKID